MNNDQHYSMELHKQIIKKFDEIEALIKGLEAHYNLDNLENLQKEIQKLPPDLKQIGLEKLNPLCSQISTDISVKIKNFYFNEPKEQWFNELNLFLNKINCHK